MNCPHCNAPNAPDARFCGSCGKATSPTTPQTMATGYDAPRDLVGREVAGRYRILAKLGEGGMGAVYRAEQISLKRTVALKMLRPDVGGATLLRRFNAEAEAVAKLSHPNTVNIFDFGQDSDGMLFIAMEFIEGRSLRTAIHNEAPLPLRRALVIASQICASIADAHAHSIIHRDLKPDNVMLQDRGKQRDVVRVLDFGIAKLRDDSRANNAMTQAGDMLGTPQYMAPEQIRAENIDGRSDVYALGCMLYEMLTARLPFEGPTVMSLLSKHLTETPPPPSQRRPDLGLPQMIDNLVMAAMAKDPAQRPPTMEAMGEHINALLATLPPDPNAPKSSLPFSAAMPVPTPQVPSFAPSTPPPQNAAPPHTPTPSPPQHPGVGLPAPTPPPMQGPLPTMPSPKKPGGSKTMLFVIIGVLVLGGAGAGIYFATRPDEKPSEHHDPPPDPDKKDIWKDTNNPDKEEPEEKEPEEKEEPEQPTEEKKPDPWGGGAGAAAQATGEMAGEMISVGQGAQFRVPPGFIVQSNAGAVSVIDGVRGIAFAFTPIDRDTDNVRKLARRYASMTGLHLQSISSDTLQGEKRKYAIFDGTVSGVRVRHVVIAFMNSSLRLAMIIHVPQQLVNDDAVKLLAAEAVQRRLVLP